MPLFERYLSLWVALCIVAGILLGRFVSPVVDTLGAMEVARVNIPVAVLIWLMILPMLLKIDVQSLSDIGSPDSQTSLATADDANFCRGRKLE